MATSRQESADHLRSPARRAVLSLTLALALLWGGTVAERSGLHHVADPANTARLEPATPAEPLLAPREPATVAIGERRTDCSGPDTNDNTATLPDPWIVAGIAGAPESAAAPQAAPSSLPTSPYEARGPPRLG